MQTALYGNTDSYTPPEATKKNKAKLLIIYLQE